MYYYYYYNYNYYYYYYALLLTYLKILIHDTALCPFTSQLFLLLTVLTQEGMARLSLPVWLHTERAYPDGEWRSI